MNTQENQTEVVRAAGSKPAARTINLPTNLDFKGLPPQEAAPPDSPRENLRPLFTPDTDTVSIPLRNKVGAVIAYALVDKEDEAQAVHRWHLRCGYARRYIRQGGKIVKRLTLHREVMQPHPSADVDHLNGNRLDNRKANLRIVSRSQNGQNRTKMDTRNTSGFRGVYFEKKAGRWKAEAKIRGVKHCAGLHDTAEQAGKAAAELRRRLGFHGA